MIWGSTGSGEEGRTVYAVHVVVELPSVSLEVGGGLEFEKGDLHVLVEVEI